MIVNRKQFGEIMGWSKTTVGNRMDEGMPHKSDGKRGGLVEIDTEQAIQWVIEKAVAKRSIKRGNKIEDMDDVKKEIVREQLRKLQLENDENEGRLVPLEDVKFCINEAIVMLASTLDGEAGRIAGGDAVLRQRLLDGHRRIRTNFADKLESFEDMERVEQIDDAAAEQSALAVGERQESSAAWDG